MTDSGSLGVASFRIVVFEETGEERQVVKACEICGVDDDDLRDFGFICSPSGVAHHTAWRQTGRTVCGHDATGDGWWWPL